MPEETTRTPVADTVPKVEDVATGEDLNFQRKWWRFEQIVWSILLLILIADGLGLFGRGWLAKAHKQTPDGALTVDYERIERASTPSIITLHFGQAALHNGRIEVYVSNSVVRPLGAQRISPQPQSSTIGRGGITYIFPATEAPMLVQIELEPSFPGWQWFQIRVPGSPPVEGHVYVVP